jgi:hypothetical protein
MQTVREPKTIVVLGMHRSATSLMAKGLNDAGVNMGEHLLGKHESNPWGHFEDIEIMQLNEAILKAAGGSWDRPPSEEQILAQRQAFDERIHALVKANDANVDPDYPLWGWKDPRTTLTIKLYLPHLTNPYFFFCFTHPAKVGISLHERDGTDIEWGTALAREYNRRLLNFIEEFNA